MIEATQEIVMQVLDFLPLTSNSNIIEGNALRMDWNTILPAERCRYIIGNPPFLGAKVMSKSQKQEVVDLFGKVKLANSIDYVAAWYIKAAQMMESNSGIAAAFVSTNSICQGQQVMPVWSTLFNKYGIVIDFAYRTFVWNSEATDQAHVHVIIVGFSKGGRSPKRTIFEQDNVSVVGNINGYLADAPNVVVDVAATPICSGVPECDYGSLINDKGNYIFTREELDAFLTKEPRAIEYIRPFIGSYEFINGKERFILYLKNCDIKEIQETMPLVYERVLAVRDFRASSSASATRKSADRPLTYFYDSTSDDAFLLIPRTSSERRRYVPIGFMDASVVASDATAVVKNANLYHFGILTSQFHNAWLRTVGGRLKSDYRYAPKTVYNTFVWPDPTEMQRLEIEALAQSVLDIRNSHADKPLAVLYSADKMPEDLSLAHLKLDEAVERAYGVDYGGDEEKIVAHLFQLYANATKGD